MACVFVLLFVCLFKSELVASTWKQADWHILLFVIDFVWWLPRCIWPGTGGNKMAGIIYWFCCQLTVWPLARESVWRGHSSSNWKWEELDFCLLTETVTVLFIFLWCFKKRQTITQETNAQNPEQRAARTAWTSSAITPLLHFHTVPKNTSMPFSCSITLCSRYFTFSVCVCVSACERERERGACTCKCVYVIIYLYLYNVYVCMYVYMLYIHTCTHAHMHAHTHIC